MNERSALPRLLFTIGDVNGIGPEVMIKAMAGGEIHAFCRPEIVGSARLLERYLALVPVAGARLAGETLRVGDHAVPIREIPSETTLRLGTIDAGAGRLAGDAIARAARLCAEGESDAMVTMPISKAALHAGGYDFPGHTEMIASVTGGTPLMILMTEGMRVALVTIHLPIAAVASRITGELVTDRARQLLASLRSDFATPGPRVAVLGLNPHAGESGEIGREEIEIIAPALDKLRAQEPGLEGPFPADGFFARFTPGEYDAVLAMYHDQGLIPLKLFARGAGVNFTANLPIVRTSPDHGTAFAIAGRGIADPTSTLQAARAAVEIIHNRAGAPPPPIPDPRHPIPDP